MSDSLETALWLAAGGAAGFAAGRWLVAPRLANATSPEPPARPNPLATTVAALAGARSPRALATGPSGSAMPVDPYAEPAALTHPGPSGSMQPIDPYAEPLATVASTTTVHGITMSPATTVPKTPTPSIYGPITMPSQLATASPVLPLAPAVSGSLVTKPSQVNVVPATSSAVGLFATKERVRRFDRLFELYRGTLPIEYVRALVERESDGTPSARNGSAVGLMQIVPVVLVDYNKRHGTTYRSEDLVEPATNVAIGCELLRLIIESYRANHPRIRTLQADWNNLRFVELLTFGWNAGYSEAGGVGRVARYLEGLGALDLTIDQVSAHARLAGASKHLSNPAKVAWCKGVASLYQRERVLLRHAALV